MPLASKNRVQNHPELSRVFREMASNDIKMMRHARLTPLSGVMITRVAPLLAASSAEIFRADVEARRRAFETS